MKNYTPRLLDRYNTKAKSILSKKLNIINAMRLPKLEKIVLNMGLGDAKDNKNTFNQALQELTKITGQKAIGTKSKKAISNFKIRQGDLVGASVTLRKNMMYEFLDRFISIASPRIRDFRGLPSKGFDGRGNYNFGISEQIVFPEINYDKVNAIRGMNITIVTSGHNDYEAYELLVSLGFPINEYKAKNKSNVNDVNKLKSIEEEKISEQTIDKTMNEVKVEMKEESLDVENEKSDKDLELNPPNNEQETKDEDNSSEES